MQANRMLIGSILLLALALFANAVALMGGRGGGAAVIPAVSANPLQDQTGLYFLGRDTFFLTSSSDGKNVFLWYYDYSPQREDNRVDFVRRTVAP